MVGVDGSSPFAPTKFGRKNKHLAETPGAFFLVVPKKYQKAASRCGSVQGRLARLNASGLWTGSTRVSPHESADGGDHQ